MIIGKTLALISLRGVVSSQRVHGVVIDKNLLATGSSYGKVPALTTRGAIVSSRMNGVLLKAPPSSSEFESNGQLYLDYLLRVSSEACFTKVKSLRHLFQHSSRTKKTRPLQVQSLTSTPRQHCTQLISSCSSALVGLLGQAFISACFFKQTACFVKLDLVSHRHGWILLTWYAYLDFLRNALSQIASSSSTQLIISLSSTRGSICVNTKNNDQFYLDYMFLGTSLIIFIESKSNGKFYLDYLLRVSSKACFNKVQSMRHSFQHPSRTIYKEKTSHLQKESIKLQAAFIAVAARAA